MNKKLNLKTKLVIMNIATLVALLLLFAILLAGERQQLMEDRQEKVRSLVESAHSLVGHYESLSRKGALPVEEAQQQALQALRKIRYGADDYFWVNDMGPVMLMHPFKPELEGKNVSSVKDPNGKALFNAFIDVVRQQGASFVDYYWPKPGASNPVPKISYVKGFQPWGWIIGTGIYVDDVDAAFRHSALRFLLWGLLIGGGITLGLMFVSRHILATLGGDPEYAKQVTQKVASGDLSVSVDYDRDHPGSLLCSMNSMLVTLRLMIGEVEENAVQVAEAASQLSSTSKMVMERVEQQSDAAASMAASMEEISVSMTQVTDNVHEANQIALEAGQLSEKGQTIIHSASGEMHKISDAVRVSSSSIQALGEQSNQITSIVNTIREIADQTNLLALNAAIEAARAGEQGRGFAVVADEVRKLAERTSQSTAEIAGMVEKIQHGAKQAVSSMDEGVAQVGEGVALASQAGDSINQIREGAERVTQVVRDISDSIREQGSAATGVAQNLERIAQMSEESAIAVRETAGAAAHLHVLSEGLHRTVGQFKIR